MRGAAGGCEAPEAHQTRQAGGEESEAGNGRQALAENLSEVQGFAACAEEGLRLRPYLRGSGKSAGG